MTWCRQTTVVNGTAARKKLSEGWTKRQDFQKLNTTGSRSLPSGSIAIPFKTLRHQYAVTGIDPGYQIQYDSYSDTLSAKIPQLWVGTMGELTPMFPVVFPLNLSQ
jgi:hypothetical protein